MPVLRVVRFALIIGLMWVWTSPAHAQFGFGKDSATPLKPTATERQSRWKTGIIIMARTGPCAGIYATVPLPVDWPDQDVKVVDEKITDNVGRVRYRTLSGHIRQMIISIPRLEAGSQAQAVLTFAITRRALPLPDTTTLKIPEKMTREVRRYLTSSPYIEVRQTHVRNQAKELLKEGVSGWEQVKTIYDWVMANIEERNVPLKGAVRTMHDGYGNHEDMAGVFIALCRACKIPARTVWVPQYCYPEFYLVDDEGKGHWIPCELKEKSTFGTLSELLPILERGDSFRVPEKKKPQRFVAEFLRGSTGQGFGQPTVKFVRQFLPMAK